MDKQTIMAEILLEAGRFLQAKKDGSIEEYLSRIDEVAGSLNEGIPEDELLGHLEEVKNRFFQNGLGGTRAGSAINIIVLANWLLIVCNQKIKEEHSVATLLDTRNNFYNRKFNIENEN